MDPCHCRRQRHDPWRDGGGNGDSKETGRRRRRWEKRVVVPVVSCWVLLLDGDDVDLYFF